MPDYANGKYIYHLTSIDNLSSIFEFGLLPRAVLEEDGSIEDIDDVADGQILNGRLRLNLDEMVPFHFFAGNPFDGRVQRDYPDKDFVIIAVSRQLAEENNWPIIPRHPLANEQLDLLDYAEGMQAIDWDAMNARDYHDRNSHSVCMAECLSPEVVDLDCFEAVFVKSERVKREVEGLLPEGYDLWIPVNQHFFVKD